jgi:hypothetical protein
VLEGVPVLSQRTVPCQLPDFSLVRSHLLFHREFHEKVSHHSLLLLTCACELIFMFGFSVNFLSQTPGFFFRYTP